MICLRSGVWGVLVLGVAGGFELEGGVFDADVEVFGDALLEVVEQVVERAVVEAVGLDDDVGGEDGQSGRDLGCVQVVDVDDLLHSSR